MKKNKIMQRIKNIWINRKEQADYWKWIFSYTKPYIPKLVLIVGLNLSVSILSVGMALITKNIIDKVTLGNAEIFNMILLYLVCVLIYLAAGAIGSAVSILVSEKYSFGIRKQIYEKIINAHWMNSQKFHTGDLMTRITSDAGNIADGIVGVIPEIIRLILELIITFFTLFYFSPKLAILALAIAPVGAIITFILGRILKKLQVKVQESESAYRSFLQESLTNLLIIKSFSNEDYAVNKLSQLRDQRFFWVFKKNKLGILTSSSLSLTFYLGYIIAFTFGAIQISKKIITYGTMSVFITLVAKIQGPIYLLSQNLPKLIAVAASSGRIMELQDLPTQTKSGNQIESKHIGIKISNLTFGYVDELVFEDASVEIKPSEFVAVIGESGIGKTTFVRLIMSFINHFNGSLVFYNDKGQTEELDSGTRRFISYVPQGNTLFSGTIRENLMMGKLDATEQDLIDALKISASYDFVSELANGLDTIIGERGHGLSEGQSQRIAIARAIIKNAPLLILDEATSALDETTELAVLKGLQLLNPKPTCILITHRNSVLEYCDKKLKIENKKIIII